MAWRDRSLGTLGVAGTAHGARSIPHYHRCGLSAQQSPPLRDRLEAPLAIIGRNPIPATVFAGTGRHLGPEDPRAGLHLVVA
jgi:hypothetical protein